MTTPSAQTTILLVDDDVRSTQLLARLLRDDGFDVETAADGETAMARLARGRAPEFLVTDLSLPGAGGVAVAKRARELCPHVRVIFVTAYAELMPRTLGRPEQVLGKPLDYSSLTAALNIGGRNEQAS